MSTHRRPPRIRHTGPAGPAALETFAGEDIPLPPEPPDDDDYYPPAPVVPLPTRPAGGPPAGPAAGAVTAVTEKSDHGRAARAGDEDQGADPATVHRGQARMAYRLADRYAGRLLHVHSIGWHVWAGNRFEFDTRGGARRAVLAELRRALSESLGDRELRDDVRRCESAGGTSGVLEIAGDLLPFASAVEDLDADPHLLNCQNGTLDLRTMRLRPHDPRDRLTKVARASFHAGARSDEWNRFISRVLPDAEVRQFVARLIGYSLLGEVREHVLPILIGTGANGKSTFDRAIRNALGDYALVAEPDLFMSRDRAHPTGEMDLLGARLVVVSETDVGRQLAEATMKRLTGGDAIRARRMRQDFVQFDPSHLALLITNHLPKVSGDDPAIWRRIRVVPFDVVIPESERDEHLDAKLELASDAILAWAVDGYADYCERGLDAPASVMRATSRYQVASDAIGRFIAECCVLTPAVKSTTAALFEAWERWRAIDGCESLSLKAFAQRITDRGYPTAPASNNKKWRVGIAVRETEPEGDQ